MSLPLDWENPEFWEGALQIKKDVWPDGTQREHLTLEVPVVVPEPVSNKKRSEKRTEVRYHKDYFVQTGI